MEEIFVGKAKCLGVVVLSALLVACGSGSSGGGRGLPEFPSRERLDEIAREERGPAFDSREKTIAADDWEPSSVPGGAAPDEQLVRATLQKGNRRATPELGCAAREIARFIAQRGGMPDQRLRNRMLGHCGATVPAHSFQSWTVDMAGTAESDASLLSRLREPLSKSAGDLPSEPTDLGGALARANDKAVFVVAFARRYADLAPVQIAPDGSVTVEGKILGPTQLMEGLITAGELGVQRCSFDQRQRFPRFRMRCVMAPSDTTAWIEVSRSEPGRLLAQGVVRVLARRPPPPPEPTTEGAPSDPAAPPAPPAESPAAPAPAPTAASSVRGTLGEVDPHTPDAFRKKLLVAVNELRRSAGLTDLKLADRQSITHEKLAPHFFASSGDDEASDDIALGLMAGWEVPGIIRDGSFYGIALSGTLSADRWLTHLLDYPAAREVLFAPDARALAVGPIIDSPSSTLGALVSTYSFYESLDHSADRKKAIDLINGVRLAAGSSPLQFVDDSELASAARAIAKGSDPGEALNQALQQIASRERGEVQGMIIETMGVEYITLPDELKRSGGMVCGLEVTHVRHRGAPWGNLVVLMALRRSGTTTAAAPAPRRF